MQIKLNTKIFILLKKKSKVIYNEIMKNYYWILLKTKCNELRKIKK